MAHCLLRPRIVRCWQETRLSGFGDVEIEGYQVVGSDGVPGWLSEEQFSAAYLPLGTGQMGWAEIAKELAKGVIRRTTISEIGPVVISVAELINGMSIVRHAIANTGVEDWRSIAAETNQLEIREEVERLCEFALRLAAHTPSQSMGVRANE